MIIICPDCATRFEVPAAALPAAGRKVRCAQCGHVWRAGPAADLDRPAPPEPPRPRAAEPELVGAEAAAAAQAARPIVSDEPPPEMIWAGSEITPRRRSVRAGNLGLAAAIVALIGAGFVVFRETIVSFIPSSAPLYAAIGFDIDTTGLDIAIEAHSMAATGRDGASTLVITGVIANVTSQERPVPAIQAVLLSEDKRELHSWSFDAGVESLKPGERHEFRQVLAQPPADTYQVYAHFAEERS